MKSRSYGVDRICELKELIQQRTTNRGQPGDHANTHDGEKQKVLNKNSTTGIPKEAGEQSDPGANSHT
jgi:hypothetical protein